AMAGIADGVPHLALYVSEVTIDGVSTYRYDLRHNHDGTKELLWTRSIAKKQVEDAIGPGVKAENRRFFKYLSIPIGLALSVIGIGAYLNETAINSDALGVLATVGFVISLFHLPKLVRYFNQEFINDGLRLNDLQPGPYPAIRPEGSAFGWQV